MNILIIVAVSLTALLLFGLSIFVHELGHFLMARWCGLVVDAFSIGFGPAIVKKTVNGTTYKISWIPLGGYVALPQLDPSGMASVQGEEKNGDTSKEPSVPVRVLPRVAPWRKILVSVSGAAGNIILATIIAWIIYLVPGSRMEGGESIVGYVDSASPAYAAGMRAGDTITSINGESVFTWYEFAVESHLSGDPSNGVHVAFERAGESFEAQLPVERLHEKPLLIGVEGVAGRSFCVVSAVDSGSPAEVAGVQSNDVIHRVDGALVSGTQHFIGLVAASEGRDLELTLRRDHEEFTVTSAQRLDPKMDRYRIGVAIGDAQIHVPQWMLFHKPFDQMKNDATGVFRILRALFMPKSKGEAGRAAGSLGGPGMIFAALWLSVRSGIMGTLGFVRFLNMNLAVLNLLPIPVLDGGHVMFALWEAIRRKPAPPKVVNALVNTFAVLLLSLVVLVTFRDVPIIGKLLGYGKKAAAEEQVATGETNVVHTVVTNTP